MRDVESLLNRHVRQMQPYAPIVPLEVLAERLHLPREAIVKLDANENPYGVSPRVWEAIRNADLHIYPDPDQTRLREAIARYIGVPAAHILCGAGADEVIDLIGRAFLQPGDALLDLPPTFGMYRWEADVCGARYVDVPRRPDFSIDVETVIAVARRERPKLLFITNPNNPDGSTIEDDALRELLQLPVLVVLDEAYIDFSAQPSRARWVMEHENLVVLRTFSKLAGMAGLRVGYGVFPMKVVRHLWKIKQPYTPNVAGSAAAIAALEDADFLRQSVQRLVAERQRLTHVLAELGWLEPLPSSANFVLCRVRLPRPIPGFEGLPTGRQLKLALERYGVLVRWFDKDGLRDCIRISVGRPEHTACLRDALAAIAASL
ncbi:MAG: histidinol-phosphate transaminase [Thermoflexales bacterium]